MLLVAPLSFISSAVRKVLNDERGSVSMIVVVVLPVLLGFAALAVDASLWSQSKNAAQAAADSAALSAVVAAKAGASSSVAPTEAFGIAATNGFTDGQSGYQEDGF
jgi:Flp pilus assembly protein TadG